MTGRRQAQIDAILEQDARILCENEARRQIKRNRRGLELYAASAIRDGRPVLGRRLKEGDNAFEVLFLALSEAARWQPEADRDRYIREWAEKCANQGSWREVERGIEVERLSSPVPLEKAGEMAREFLDRKAGGE